MARSWSEEQAELFLFLLEKRSSLSTVTPLANVPVYVWLVSGERWVPLRQVRKALASWTGVHGRVSVTRAGRSARELLAQIAGPESRRSDRRHLIELIERAAGGASLDPSVLEEAVARIVPPEQATLARGYAHLVESTVSAALNLERLSDEVFELARVGYRTSLAVYLRGRLAQNPQDDDSAEAEQIRNNACKDLLTHIGLQLTYAHSITEGSHGIDDGDK